MMRLSGRVAVITGSTRGIGRAIAEVFSSEGASVVVNSRNQADSIRVASEIGGDAVGVATDIGTPDGVELLFAEVTRLFGRVDVLVNNAGMSMVRDSFELTLEDWQRTMDLNLTAPFLCSQHAGRMMRAAGGSIINVASLTSFAPFPRRLAYGVTKAGLVMLTRILAAEWAPQVRVNAVAPGFILTDEIKALEAQKSIDLDAIQRRTPQGKLGQPEDVAKACLFLASTDANFITGETLVTDGGWLSYGYI